MHITMGKGTDFWSGHPDLKSQFSSYVFCGKKITWSICVSALQMMIKECLYHRVMGFDVFLGIKESGIEYIQCNR